MPFSSLPEDIKSHLKSLIPDYNILKVSSKGANGYTIFANNRLIDRKVAIKYYYWNGKSKYHFEPKSLASLKSTYISEIYDANTISNEWAYFTTPYYKYGDLDDVLSKSRPSILKAVSFIECIGNGLVDLHKSSYLHRDIKPENIFVTDKKTAVIGDFGSVIKLPEDESKASGSGHALIYRPPESVNYGYYSHQSDIYQLGVTFYQLLGGYIPYDETSWLNKGEKEQYSTYEDIVDRSLFVDNIIKDKIARGRIVNISTLDSYVCKKLKKIIKRLCTSDMTRRYDKISELLSDIHRIKLTIPDWRFEGKYPVLFVHKDKYTIRKIDDIKFCATKLDKNGTWRKIKSLECNTFDNIIVNLHEYLSLIK